MSIKAEIVPGLTHSKKIHQLNMVELQEYWVSDFNQFKDNRWRFENKTAGSSSTSSTLNWSMRLYDGSALTDKLHERRLFWAKVLMLTLIKEPKNGGAPAPGSMSGHQQCFKWFLSWMSDNGLHIPEELTRDVIEHYLDDLPRFICDCVNDDESEVKEAAVRRALGVLSDLWCQRGPLQKMGIKTIEFNPFFKKGIFSYAKDISNKGIGWIKPMPDEVAIPIFNKAFNFLEGPAADILELIDSYRFLEKENNAQRKARIREKLRKFEFRKLPGESLPWNAPLWNVLSLTETRNVVAPNAVRTLAHDLLGAAVIVLQGTSGMRISEVCAISAGVDARTGLPVGVRLEKSLTGLYEWFVIKSVLAKTTDGLPIEVEWVLGMRELGSEVIPPAVKALQLLNALYEPWRGSAQSSKLILGFKGHISLPLPTNSLSGILSDSLRGAMKEFIARWIDFSSLPNESLRKTDDNDLVPWRESRGRVFSTHMLRKSWANYVLAVNPALLSAIQMQFHHLNLSMTEGGYIGNNPLLVEPLQAVSRQVRNRGIYEAVTGKSVFAGRMGLQIEESVSELRSQILSLSNSDRWKKVVEWADLNELEWFFSPHATCCPVHTSQMRCHNVSDTPVWIRKVPNYAERAPSTCAGCACAIMDKSHEPFWADRYVRSKVAIEENKLAGAGSSLRTIEERALQAAKILRKLGGDVKKLDVIVEHEIRRGFCE